MECLLFYGLLSLGLGVFLFIKGFVWLRSKRFIENIPTSKVRSIAMGLVEVAGRVVPFGEKVLKSPFTEKDCVSFCFSIDELKGLGRERGWVTVKKGSDYLPFYIEDETGRVLVDPKGAKVEILEDYEFRSDFMGDPPDSVKRFLRKKGISDEGFFGSTKQMRFRERFIEPGDKLYVMGCAGDNPFIEEGTAQGGGEDVMIGKGMGEFFYISDRSEKRILSGLKWRVIVGFFGGGILTVGGLWIILYYYYFYSFLNDILL